MATRSPPNWIMNLTQMAVTNRQVLHNIGGRLSQPIKIRTGVEMGNPASDAIVQINLDPLIRKTEHQADIVKTIAYMDDILVRTNIRGIQAFQAILREYGKIGPMKMTSHDCWRNNDQEEGSPAGNQTGGASARNHSAQTSKAI